MNIFRKKDEILASLGNMRAMKRLHVDTYTENIIKSISGIKIAESKDGQFWVEFQELNETLFLNSTILSKIDLKTFKGAKIILLTEDYEIEINSDERTIESDFSNVSNTWITKVSFIIDSKERKIIEERNFEELEYKFKTEVLNLRVVAKIENS
ncbi:hypothetical protein CXF68_00280 [Tenacibaculum sp. Bg11-29]|uniref:hypothetical protein n=1 Tax=Tenacibaculum sp. Bg11-29 TaxID=2058306 RepID=UPI000C323BD3|nr:hypothetical protein [Tenacibaculum sp. Bg11-29]PKH49216.1 hypothetical protein CXF68_00280 [Tenacibaculum sp. Bg11-29]